jgi:hypothetical protein
MKRALHNGQRELKMTRGRKTPSFVLALSQRNASKELAGFFEEYRKGQLRLPKAEWFFRLEQEKRDEHRYASTAVHNRYDGIGFNMRRLREVNPAAHAMLEFALSSIRSPKQVSLAHSERMALIKQLNNLGHTVLVPNYKGAEIDARTRSELKGKARTFNARLPTYELQKEQQIHPNAFWTRDLWVKLKGKRYKITSLKGINEAYEGGKLVPIGRNSFIASEEMRELPEIKQMAKEGTKFYFMEEGYKYEPILSKMLKKKTYTNIDHPDLFVGQVGRVLLYDHRYYVMNSGAITTAAKENGLKRILIPQEEANLHPANFITLGENTALVDRNAKKTIALLRANGVKVIPSRISPKANLAAGGGLRCMVNEL